MESRDLQLAELSRRLAELQAELERLKQEQSTRARKTSEQAACQPGVQTGISSSGGGPACTPDATVDTEVTEGAPGSYKGRLSEPLNAIDAEFLARMNNYPIQAIAIGRFRLPNGKSLPWMSDFQAMANSANPGTAVEAISEEQVATTLEPFVSPKRIKILKELFKAPLSSSELTLRTGLVGGQLYHHLTVLEEARMIAKDRERYVLTYCGAKLLFLLAMAACDTWNAIQAMPVERLPYD